MKQKIFTLLMMLALMVVAGSAMAQNKFAPFPGRTYTYNSTIALNSIGTVSVSLGTGMSLGTTSPSNFNAVPAATTALSFEIEYDETCPEGEQTIVVSIAGADGCTNQISFVVDVQALPTISLAVVASKETICPAVTPTASLTPGTSAASAALDNSFTYIVTPTITPTSGYTYDFGFNIAPATSPLGSFTVTHTTTGTESGTVSVAGNYASGWTITGSTATTHVFTVHFNTTEGVANTTYTGTAGIATLHITDAGAGGNYVSTTTPSDAVVINEMPSIGAFN